jgi:hypothetical protein
VTASSQYRLLVHALREAHECGRQVVPLLDAVVLAPDKPTRDDALQASGRPCQELLRHLVEVLDEGTRFLEEMGESPLELGGVRRAHRAFAEEFAMYRYHHEAEELAPRLALVLSAVSELAHQLGLLPRG